MRCLRPLHSSRERGAALFLAILTLFILTIMGIGLMFTSSIENTLAGTETKISKIFYAAESGVEYAGTMLANTVAYTGGTMPVGVSSNYPTLSSPDMQVTLTQPVMIGYATIPGDPVSSGGHVYGSPGQFYEIVYAVESGATSTKTQASKTIDAEVGVYPKELSIPK
jgi:Tfp pilus assembly protein PilX